MLDHTITAEVCFEIETGATDSPAWASLAAFAQSYKDSKEDGRDPEALKEDAVRMAALTVDSVMMTHFRGEVEAKGLDEGECLADVLNRDGFYARVSAVTKKVNETLGSHIS